MWVEFAGSAEGKPLVCDDDDLSAPPRRAGVGVDARSVLDPNDRRIDQDGAGISLLLREARKRRHRRPEERPPLREGDAVFLSNLTNWYDSREAWTRRTIVRGTEEIMGVCMNILGSTAPDWIPLMIPFSAIGGGFTSRIIFVVEDKKGKIIEDPNEIQVDEKLKADLVHDLEQISLLVGEFVTLRFWLIWS